MTVNQISVFVENRAGQLAQFIHLLAKHDIDLEALSIADTKDYGIIRIIADSPEKAAAALTAEGWVFTVTPVLAVTVPDEPGSLERIFSILAEHNINLEYTYAFLTRKHGLACVILRVDGNDHAAQVLAEAGIRID